MPDTHMKLRPLFLFTFLMTCQKQAVAQTAETPAHQSVTTLVSSAALPDQPYLAYQFKDARPAGLDQQFIESGSGKDKPEKKGKMKNQKKAE